MFIGGEKKTIVAEGEPRYSAYYELESAEVLTSEAWAKAVEAGRWPSEVRPVHSQPSPRAAQVALRRGIDISPRAI